MNPQIDRYLEGAARWRPELETLRRILLECGLTEELKWGSPCYCHGTHNVAIIGELKTACVLGFFKGALLQDPRQILSKPGENTRAARQIRFTGVGEILEKEAILKTYLQEAIAIEQAGLKVELDPHPAPDAMPAELEQRFRELPALRTAFESLTPGRRRAYLLHFSAPKQAATRLARIEKCRPAILAGRGLNDR